MTDRKFHKYVFRYEVLSEEPLDDDMGVDDLHAITYDGPCSGRMLNAEHTELNGKEAADALIEQASDPEFFQITADGDDLDEANEDGEDVVHCAICGCDLKDGKCPEGCEQPAEAE